MGKYVIEKEFLKVKILSYGSTPYFIIRKTDKLNLIVNLEDNRVLSVDKIIEFISSFYKKGVPQN